MRPRLGAHRRIAGAQRSRHPSRHRGRHLDRGGGRRLLRHRRARRGGALRARPDPAQGAGLSRLQLLGLRADHRPAPVQCSRSEHEGRHHRVAAQAVCCGRNGDRHRPRGVAVARPHRRCGARLLCAAGHFPARGHRRALAVRRRARQSDPGLGVPGARCALRDRRQRQLGYERPRHGRPAARGLAATTSATRTRACPRRGPVRPQQPRRQEAAAAPAVRPHRQQSRASRA